MELFDFTFLHSQMFWLVLCFVVLLVFMQKFAVPMISHSLDERASQIKKDLADAEDLRAQAQELLAQYTVKMEEVNQKADEIITETKNNAKILADKKTAELEQKLQDKSEQATKVIESAKKKAIEELKSEACRLTIAATEKLVLETVDVKKAKELTDKAIKQLNS